MTYTSALQVPKRRQWEANSLPYQSANCGPTSVSFIADYYKDRTHSINGTRNLVPLNLPTGGTSATEQAAMLTARGVPASVKSPTAAELSALVATRPVIVGMLMGLVPAAIRGHSFLGVHAVAVRGNKTVNGVKGKVVMDPNFDYGHTPDATNGFRFYPDSVVEAARSGTRYRRCVVPDKPKALRIFAVIPAGGLIYNAPILAQAHVVATGPATLPYTGNTEGDDYTYPGGVSTKWAKVNRNGGNAYVPYYRVTFTTS